MTKKVDSHLIFTIRDSDKILRENVNRVFHNAHIMIPDEFYTSEELTKEQRAWLVDRMAQRNAAQRSLWSEAQADRMAQEIASLDDSVDDYDHVVFGDSAEAMKFGATFEARTVKASGSAAAKLEEIVEAIESISPTKPKPLPPPPPTPPGGTLISIARVLLSKEAYKRYVEPHIADIQYEYAEEMSKGRKLRAWYRVALGHLLWLWPLGYALWKKLSPLWNLASK